MKFRIRMKIHRAMRMPCIIVDKPGCVKTMSAAARAASYITIGSHNRHWRNNHKILPLLLEQQSQHQLALKLARH